MKKNLRMLCLLMVLWGALLVPASGELIYAIDSQEIQLLVMAKMMAPESVTYPSINLTGKLTAANPQENITKVKIL
jgi:hypothetical protein